MEWTQKTTHQQIGTKKKNTIIMMEKHATTIILLQDLIESSSFIRMEVMWLMP